VCDALGNPVAFHLTAGQDSDLEGADALMEEMTKGGALLGDKAYDADERVREKLRDKGCTAVIPPKKNRLNPADYDKDLYKDRRLIENFFAKLKQYRALATRYDKTASYFLGAIYMASSVIWLI
jgi:transposase